MTTNTTEAVVEYEKGTWQATLRESSTLLDRSTKARNRASALLWSGAQTGIETWIDDPSDDVAAEGLYATVMEALGKSRKGDASKIKTVALAVLNNGLEMGQYDNLSKAYAAASHLTKTVKVEAAEDEAANEVIEAIEAPKTASTIDSAAALLLSKGLDGAVVAILDLLGKDNEPAHRAFMRAVSTEVASRVQAKAAAAKAIVDAERAADKEKRDAERAEKQAEREAAAAERAKTKAAAAKKASTKAKTPAKSTTGKPAPVKAKAAPAKAKPAPVKAKAKPVAKR